MSMHQETKLHFSGCSLGCCDHNILCVSVTIAALMERYPYSYYILKSHKTNKSTFKKHSSKNTRSDLHKYENFTILMIQSTIIISRDESTTRLSRFQIQQNMNKLGKRQKDSKELKKIEKRSRNSLNSSMCSLFIVQWVLEKHTQWQTLNYVVHRGNNLLKIVLMTLVET